jgi:acyl-CoA thioester hydrolase
MNLVLPHEETVLPAWIDHNGHMNLAYYVLVFDHATRALLEALSLGSAYSKRTGRGVHVEETHTLYQRELLLGAPISTLTHLIAADATRLHIVQEMFHAHERFRAALQERLLQHLVLSDRAPAPFPAERLARIKTILDTTAARPLPEDTGRRIAMPMPKPPK